MAGVGVTGYTSVTPTVPSYLKTIGYSYLNSQERCGTGNPAVKPTYTTRRNRKPFV